jgi:hypothetical protein
VLEVSDPSRARVQVYLGQELAPFVRIGDAGVIALDQHPEVRLSAHVRRIADALDPRTRSMLVELWPDDEAGGGFRLVPGLFVHVSLRVRAPALPTVPAEPLASRGEGLQVALVQDGRLHFVDVEPGLNDGKTLQIRRGLAGGELIALSPPSDLADGAPVRPVEPGPQQAGRPPGAAREARAPPTGGEGRRAADGAGGR